MVRLLAECRQLSYGKWHKCRNKIHCNASTRNLQWGPVKDLGKDIVKGIRDLKATDGPDLIVSGSSTLTSVLFKEGLVDELILIVYPVLLGRGKRILSETVDARELAFVSTKQTPTGLFVNTYTYVGAVKK